MPLLLGRQLLSHDYGSIDCPCLVGNEVPPTRIINPKLIATPLPLLISLSATPTPETAIVASVCQSVVLVVETQLVGHTLPFRVEIAAVLRLHIPEQIVALGGSAGAPDALSDHLASLVVEHALVGHFLVPSARIFVHLVALSDSVTAAHGTLGLGLVGFGHRVAISIGPCLGYLLHLGESAITRTPKHGGVCRSHLHLHALVHLVDHFVDATSAERLCKEWVIRERITPAPESILHHRVHHLVGHLVVPLHSLHHTVERGCCVLPCGNLLLHLMLI